MSVASMHKCVQLQSFYDHDKGEGRLGKVDGQVCQTLVWWHVGEGRT